MYIYVCIHIVYALCREWRTHVAKDFPLKGDYKHSTCVFVCYVERPLLYESSSAQTDPHKYRNSYWEEWKRLKHAVGQIHSHQVVTKALPWLNRRDDDNASGDTTTFTFTCIGI